MADAGYEPGHSVAFQEGFDGGAAECAKIDMDEIQQRRGDLPQTLQVSPEGTTDPGQADIDNDTLSTLMQVLGKIFNPAKPPTLSTDAENCPDAQLQFLLLPDF